MLNVFLGLKLGVLFTEKFVLVSAHDPCEFTRLFWDGTGNLVLKLGFSEKIGSELVIWGECRAFWFSHYLVNPECCHLPNFRVQTEVNSN